LVTLHGDEAGFRVDGKHILSRLQSVADLGVECVHFVMIAGVDPAHQCSCGNGDENGLVTENVPFAELSRRTARMLGRS